jgi:predicted  nucleic acid-binding Zn-ribbon protein
MSNSIHISIEQTAQAVETVIQKVNQTLALIDKEIAYRQKHLTSLKVYGAGDTNSVSEAIEKAKINIEILEEAKERLRQTTSPDGYSVLERHRSDIRSCVELVPHY